MLRFCSLEDLLARPSQFLGDKSVGDAHLLWRLGQSQHPNLSVNLSAKILPWKIVEGWRQPQVSVGHGCCLPDVEYLSKARFSTCANL
jgi:hypothetical protein